MTEPYNPSKDFTKFEFLDTEEKRVFYYNHWNNRWKHDMNTDEDRPRALWSAPVREWLAKREQPKYPTLSYNEETAQFEEA